MLGKTVYMLNWCLLSFIINNQKKDFIEFIKYKLVGSVKNIIYQCNSDKMKIQWKTVVRNIILLVTVSKVCLKGDYDILTSERNAYRFVEENV